MKKKKKNMWHDGNIPSDVEGSYTGISETGGPPCRMLTICNKFLNLFAKFTIRRTTFCLSAPRYNDQKP